MTQVVQTSGRSWSGVRQLAVSWWRRAKVADAARVVAGDIRSAWLFHGSPPSLATVFSNRIPEAKRVPGYVDCERGSAPVCPSAAKIGQGIGKTMSCASCRGFFPGNPRLRRAWLVWNHVVALPVTAVAYTVAWLHQHPGRAALAYAIVTVAFATSR